MENDERLSDYYHLLPETFYVFRLFPGIISGICRMYICILSYPFTVHLGNEKEFQTRLSVVDFAKSTKGTNAVL